MLNLIALVLTALTGGAGAAPADPGLELLWGAGAPPRYVPARAPEPAPRQAGGYELRWGTGGPPVLVPIGR